MMKSKLLIVGAVNAPMWEDAFWALFLHISDANISGLFSTQKVTGYSGVETRWVILRCVSIRFGNDGKIPLPMPDLAAIHR